MVEGSLEKFGFTISNTSQCWNPKVKATGGTDLRLWELGH